MSKLSGWLGFLSVLLLLVILASLAFAAGAWWQQRGVRDAYEQELILADAVLSVYPLEPIWILQNTESLWNSEHILGVRYPTLMHHPTEKHDLLLIAMTTELREGLTVTGRWYEKDGECCVNRAEYERLLADPEADFTGLGDTVTYHEEYTFLKNQYNQKGALIGDRYKTWTVVGVVEEEGMWSDTKVYAPRHVYATMIDVSSFFLGYDVTGSMAYQQGYAINAGHYSAAMRGYRVLSDRVPFAIHMTDSGDMEYMNSSLEVFTEKELAAQYTCYIPNEGYSIEIQFDSVEALEKYRRLCISDHYANLNTIKENLESETYRKLYPDAIAIDEKIVARDDGDEWRSYSNIAKGLSTYVMAHTPRDPAPIRAAYEANVQAYRGKLLAAAAAAGLSLIAMIACGIARRHFLKEARRHV